MMRTAAKTPGHTPAERFRVQHAYRWVRTARWRTLKRLRRVSRRGVLLAMLYAAAAVPGAFTSLHAVSREAADRSPEEFSMLEFISGRSAGTVRIMDPRDRRRRRLSLSSDREEGWTYLGPAKGSIRVERCDLVWLELDEFVFDRPSLLSRLGPNDLYRVSVAEGSPQVDARLLDRIADLDGLQELDLSHAWPLPVGWERVTQLPHLQRMWLPESLPAGRASLSKDWVLLPTFQSGASHEGGLLYIRHQAPVHDTLDK